MGVLRDTVMLDYRGSSIREHDMRSIVAGITIAMLLTSAAAAAPTSQYTSIAPDKCRQLTADEESGSVTFTCPGLYGTDVWVGEGDLRTFLAYGPQPTQQCVSQQTFTAFNNAGPTLEWRIDNGEAFATIIRYHMDHSDGRKYNFLVVTTLRGGQACHIGYVDGALPKHNQKARDLADSQARTFDCSRDQPVMLTNRDFHKSHMLSGVPCGPDAPMKFQ